MISRRVLSCAVAGLLLVLAACSGSGSEGGAEQAQLEAAYRTAVESSRQCVADEGFTVTDMTPASDGIGLLYGVHFPGGAPEGEPDRSQAVDDACRSKFAVDEKYAALFESHVPTGVAREQLWDDYLSCLDSAGVTVTNLSLSMHPNEVVDYLFNGSEGGYEPNESESADLVPKDREINNKTWDCMGKYHYLIFPSNE